MDTFNFLKNKKNLQIMAIISILLPVAGCGAKEGAKAPQRNVSTPQGTGVKEIKGTNDGTGQSGTLLDMDPAKMSDQELDRFIVQLTDRNKAELDEYFFLQALNKELCDRLQRLRTECVAAIRLIPDGTEKILGCDGSYSTTTNVSHKFEATIAGGPFSIEANSTYKTASLANGTTQDVKFTNDTSVRAPKFMDLTSLRLVSAATLPAIGSVDFSFKVNETVLFTKADLIAADDTTAKYFRINPTKILELKNKAECTVTIEEVQKLRQEVLDRAKR